MTHFSLTPQLIADLLVAAFFLIEALRPRRAAPHRTDRGTTVVFWGCYVITLLALNIQTSFLSPPVAMAPFYLKGVAPKHVNINDIFRGVMPFIFIVLIAMVLLYVFPEIGMWLPRQVYGH